MASPPNKRNMPPVTRDRPAEQRAERIARGERQAPTGPKAGTLTRQAAPAGLALGTGLPLPANERRYFEDHLQADLSAVRIHPEAEAAHSLGANAFAAGRDIGFAATREGMRYGYFLGDGWRPLGSDGSDELRARPWGDGVEVTLERDGEVVTPAEQVPAEADFACFSSGELTPFRIDLRRSDVAQAWRLEGQLDGKLTLTMLDDAR